jgi:homogentisate 1,2-dioxygenase
MIDRMSCGLMPDKPHTVLRDPHGKLLYEEMHTRGGFSGPFTYLYHRHAPTPAAALTTTRGHALPKAHDDGPAPLRRRLYDTRKMTPVGTLFEDRVPLLFNRDITIYFACPAQTDDVYFANGDGDELWFVQEGAARLESVCGWLPVRAGDYVWVPRSMIHRWHVEPGKPLRMMCVEAHGGMMIPNDFKNPVGQLKMDAPYTHRDFVRPEGPIATIDHVPEGPRELVVKKSGAFTRLMLEHSPMDVVGWDGFVYPWAFAIEKYQPKTGMVHLPPTIHTTFAGPGFLVCSFVPRVTDTHPQAIPCPYPHSSVDCDEVILYLRGNFTSRRGVGPGAISLHPSGVVHGPHPGAYEGSIGSTRTDELAVMLDTYSPLVPTAQAANLEDTGYHDSWRSAGAV